MACKETVKYSIIAAIFIQNLNYQIIFQFLEHDIKQKVYGRVCDNERMRQMVDMNKPIWPL